MTSSPAKPCAIVSGGATGIGSACAVILAERGYNVTVNYNRSADRAAAVVERCRAAGAKAIAVQGDVADNAACREVVRHSLDEWGGLDVLVNNAGVTHFAEARDLDAQTKDDFQRIMSVNLVGSYQLTRAAVPHLNDSSIASVVNISSHAGFSGLGSSSAYAASKGALNTLTLALARALAPKIRVNAVCPGFVDTDWMLPKLGAEKLAVFKQESARIAPLKRVVSPEDVAEAVSWFATGGRSITGQLLVIDGGTHLSVGSPL